MSLAYVVEPAWPLIPAVYLLSLSIGRHLKRRHGVALGLAYHLGGVAYGALAAHLLGGVFDPASLAGIAAAIGATPDEATLATCADALKNTLVAVCALTGTAFALALVERFYWQGRLVRRGGEAAPRFLRQIVAGAAYLAVLMILLQVVFRMHIPGLLAGSGILVAVVGFAMQDLLGNVIAGASLNLGKPFRVGDWLLLDGRQAEVVEVNWRSTRLRTNDNHALDYPNNLLAKLAIVNFGPRGSVHAMRITVGVGYETPPNAAKAALLRATRHTSGVLAEPASVIQLRDFGDNAVLYDVKFYIADQAGFPEIADGIRTHIWYELHREGMSIPSPVRNLRIERPHRLSRDEKIAAIARSILDQPLFGHLRDDEALTLAEGSRTVLYGAGEAVVKTGEAGESLFLVVSGTVRVELPRDAARSVLATLGAGDCFGEMSLLTGAPRAADVFAETDCELVEVSKPAFAGILRKRPELAPLLGDVLARRRAASDAAHAALAPAERDSETRRRGAELLAGIAAFFRL